MRITRVSILKRNTSCTMIRSVSFSARDTSEPGLCWQRRTRKWFDIPESVELKRTFTFLFSASTSIVSPTYVSLPVNIHDHGLAAYETM